jgi:hypothetical protein
MLEARFPQNLRVITLGDARLSPSYAGDRHQRQRGKRQSAHVIRQAIACAYLFRTAVWK